MIDVKVCAKGADYADLPLANEKAIFVACLGGVMLFR